MILTDENGFWNNKKAPINTLVDSHNSQGRSGLPCEFDADLW